MWEEKYLLDKELKRWTSNFLQKFGEDSLFVYNTENWDEVSANQSIFWWWLFSQKKLTIIKWVPLDNSKWNTFKIDQIDWFIENFIKKEWKIPQDNLLVFVSNKPDKRSRFFKFLKDRVNVKEFKLLKDNDLKNFILNDLWDIKIEEKALSFFVYRVWSDLYRIENELDKLKTYCREKNIKNITLDMVDSIVFGMIETQAFDFLKLLFKDKQKSLEYLQKMQDQWLNWNAFSWALYWWLKLYITLYEFAKNGIKDTKTIAQRTWINTFVLWQNIKNIEVIQKNWIEIKDMYKSLIEVEFDIKSGKKSEESFWLETKKMIVKFNI